jgi:hypothetical protein
MDTTDAADLVAEVHEAGQDQNTGSATARR